MAAAAAGERSLKETPTWAVAFACAVFVITSILIEHGIYSLGKWLQKRQKKAMNEALEKIKAVSQIPISKICIPAKAGSIMLPCSKKGYTGSGGNRRKLLWYDEDVTWRRVLAATAGDDYCFKYGKVALVSQSGLHQLHIFIFVLAVFHVLYSVITLVLAKAKMKKWKAWEAETTSLEYQSTNGHLTSSSLPVLCSCCDFVIFIDKTIMLYFEQDGSWYTLTWMSFMPLAILLLVGTKLEVIIMEMAQQIQDRTTVVKGAPVVEPSNKYFWFNQPDWILFLIHQSYLVLGQALEDAKHYERELQRVLCFAILSEIKDQPGILTWKYYERKSRIG
nr:mlo protein like 1 [Quercus suber]